MKSKQGFAPVIIVLAVFILLALALGAYYMKTQNMVSDQNEMTYEATPSTEPLSESTDEGTIQQEIDETDPGEIDMDIQLLEKDTLSL